ncbi:hypothetical protein ACWYRQ_19375 [Clostridioides difficile]
MIISSQYRSQHSFSCESDMKDKKTTRNIIKKNDTAEKDDYISNIMRQKQELNNRIQDLKDKQELYTKKINEAIRNLSKVEVRFKNSTVEDESKNTVLDEDSIFMNTKEENEFLVNKKLNNKEEILNDKELDEIEQKHINKYNSYKKEDKDFENLFLEGKTREELEDMLKNFINMTQEEIKEIESRIKKLDKDSEKYKQNSNTNILDKDDKPKKHIDILI